ncbi:aldehyde dehydrogenase family protein [Nocardioides ochotonae]|uniref:aldehyde dehydrogenase family protein n=1 Tax=Nocardioides ochotonae TaxID=2685869 RepID=UPI00140D6687|nr:aldehyde dehydrogenase family protein [Nocardioides ochotonae]
MTATDATGTAARLEVPEVVEIIAGVTAVPGDRLELVLEDPFTGAELGHAVASTADAVERALAAATEVHVSGSWSSTPIERRADILEAIADAVMAEVPRLAALESFATGVPVSQTQIVALIDHAAFRLAAAAIRNGALHEVTAGESGRAVEVHRLPLGPALNLVPWNAPAPMAAHKIASSLAAGAPTILKPSEYAPYATTELGRIVARVLDDEGVAPGTFQLVQGGAHVGGTMVTDRRIRAVSFTGGLIGGKAIAAACAANFTSLQLELGGNNPLLVLPDADPAAAAQHAADLLTTLNGQWCRALGRLIVPEALAEEIVELTLGRLAQLQAGDPLDETTQLGPIVHSVHRARLLAAIEERVQAGGTARAATALPEGGHFLAPTLITGVPDEAAHEEVFGPVATVHTYRTEEEALALANATPFGLEGYVVGSDEERALAVARRVQAGEVKVNGSTIMNLHLMTPRPAWGWSGMGEEGTVETIRIFTGARVVGVEGGFALHGR